MNTAFASHELRAWGVSEELYVALCLRKAKDDVVGPLEKNVSTDHTAATQWVASPASTGQDT